MILCLPNLPIHIFFHHLIAAEERMIISMTRTLSFHESQENTKIQANEPSPWRVGTRHTS